MAIDPRAIWNLIRSMRSSDEQTTSSATATVTRVEPDGSIWVRVNGGDDDTPVAGSLVKVIAGDTVDVDVSEGVATITGSVTSPSVGSREVERETAEGLHSISENVRAIRIASEAADKEISKSVKNAQDSADEAQESADAAQDSADAAQQSADAAQESADAAQEDADEAKESASNAVQSATTAYNALSDVERVVGTLNWITEHGSYVAATEHTPASGAVYYRREGTSPNYSYVVVSSVPDADVPTAWQKTSDTAIDPSKTYYLRHTVYGNPTGYVEGNDYYTKQSMSRGYVFAGGTPGYTSVPLGSFGANVDLDSIVVTSVKNSSTTLQEGNDYTYDASTRTVYFTRPMSSPTVYFEYYEKTNDDAATYVSGHGTEYFGANFFELSSESYTAVESPSVAGLRAYYEGTSFDHYENDPAMAGLYRLNVDESIQNYIAQHLSLTNDGLWLTGDSVLERILISSGSDNYDAGMYIMHGGSVVGYYGENAVIGNTAGAHITVGTDSNGNPRIGLWQNASVEVAYISNNELYIERTVVLSAMRIGNWQWAIRPNGNLALQWIGG